MKIGKKLLIPILSIGLLMAGSSEISYAKTAESMDTYYSMIDNNEILPPQYMDGNSPNKIDWVNSVKKQNVGNIEGSVKWSADKKSFKIKKIDQNGNPVKGVTFNVYNTKTDAKNGTNSIGSATSDDEGNVIFNNLPLYYGFYIKETKVPDGYAKSNEIVSVYRDNGVRFLGEMTVTGLNSNIKGGTDKDSLSDKGTKNLNTYLQGLVSGGSTFNNNTNWLVYNDNGVEKLVSKRPIKYGTAWNSLYNAGVVFGEDGVKDLINADFTSSNYEYYSQPARHLKDYNQGKGTSKTYKPQYVNINGKTYIVRLMRAYNENAKINDNKSWGSWDSNTSKLYAKGSEWNRLILPLINPSGDNNNTGYNNGTNGRYGSYTKGHVESNMPTLANYSWWKDFGGNSNNLGNYSKGNDYGVYRWTQETGYDGAQYRACRGYGAGYGAAYSYSDLPYSAHISRGWLVVLERVS